MNTSSGLRVSLGALKQSLSSYNVLSVLTMVTDVVTVRLQTISHQGTECVQSDVPDILMLMGERPPAGQ